MDITRSFPLEKYPTLHKFALSPAKIKFVVGPAGCLDADTEVLTRHGWVKISTMPDEILVYDPTNKTAKFDRVEPVKYECPEGLHRFYTSYAMDMVVSDEHKVWYQTYYNRSRNIDEWQIITGKDLSNQYKSGTARDGYVPTVFDYVDGDEYPLTDDQLRIMVMVSADGSLPNRGKRCVVTVRKERKKERIRQLLDSVGIVYTESDYYRRNGAVETSFRFEPPEWSKDLTRYYSCTKRQLAVIASECLLWDGNVSDKGSYYVSSDKGNVDFIQFAFVATGIPSVIRTESYDNGWRPTYRATFGENKKTTWVNMKTARYEHIPAPDGYKYCFHTTTGMFVARRNGKVFCTGNSAKTSYMTMEILRRACMQEPNRDGIRRTRVLVGRNTYQILKSATIKTFMEMWGGFAQFKTGSFPMMAFLRIELTDGTKVHCDVEFISFDTPESITKLLGYEPTMVFLDEISELPVDVIEGAARRVGRFPPKDPSTGFKGATWSGVIGATNGPRKSHWLYDWYLGKNDDKFEIAQRGSPDNRKQFELFFQPPALLRTVSGDWIPNPRAENIDNLADGYGYYYDMLSGKDADIQAYVEGRFADLVTGKLVFPQFNHSIHVVDHNKLNLTGGFPLYLSFDFGRTPFCSVATTFEGGSLVVIDEIMGEDMSMETLVNEHVLPKLRKRYPKAWVEDAWADPAGEVKTQAVELSPYDVLRNNGIPVQNPDPGNRLEPRIEAVRQMLTKLSSSGRPMLRISSNCPVTIASLGSDYIYELKRGTNGVVQDKPTKSHVNWVSEAADAVQYLAIGYNSMLGVRERRGKYRHLPKLNRGFL